jgi:GAF domain-containing protein
MCAPTTSGYELVLRGSYSYLRVEQLHPARVLNVDRVLLKHPNPKLLQMIDLMVYPADLTELFHEVATRLPKISPFDFAAFAIHDPTKNVMQVQLWKEGAQVSVPREFPVYNSGSGWIWSTQELVVMPDVQRESRFPELLEGLRAAGVRSCYAAPLTTPQRRVGAMGLGFLDVREYGDEELRFLQQVAELVALCVENVTTRRALKKEEQRVQTLIEVGDTLVTKPGLRQFFPFISAYLRRVLHHEFASVALREGESGRLRMQVLDFPLSKGFIGASEMVAMEDAPSGVALGKLTPLLFSRDDLIAMNSNWTGRLLGEGIRTLCCVPLITSRKSLGTLNVGSTRDYALGANDVSLLRQVAAQVAIALENSLAHLGLEQEKIRLKLLLEVNAALGKNLGHAGSGQPRRKCLHSRRHWIAGTGCDTSRRGDGKCAGGSRNQGTEEPAGAGKSSAERVQFRSSLTSRTSWARVPRWPMCCSRFGLWPPATPRCSF